MKIAIYYPWIYLTSGIERSILEYIKRTRNTIVVFTNRFEKRNTFPELADFEVKELKRIPVRRDLFSVLVAAVTIAFQKIDLTGFDAMIVHSEGLGDLILTRNRKLPAICYCHTPLRPVFDKEYIYRVYSKKNILWKICYAVLSRTFRVIDRVLWKNYRKIFFNSKETLRRARDGGLLEKISGSKIRVLHPGVTFTKPKPSKVFKRYFFLPGRITWTKGVEFAVRSFLLFRSDPGSEHFKLIIAGRLDEKSGEYFKELKRIIGKSKDILIIKNPSQRMMNKLYNDCWAVLSGSFNEDWGITLVEGNSFGKPVLAIKRGGPVESQINGKTALLVNENESEYANAISRLSKDKNLVVRMGKSAFDNSQKYNWNYYTQSIDSALTKLG